MLSGNYHLRVKYFSVVRVDALAQKYAPIESNDPELVGTRLLSRSSIIKLRQNLQFAKKFKAL